MTYLVHPSIAPETFRKGRRLLALGVPMKSHQFTYPKVSPVVMASAHGAGSIRPVSAPKR